MSDEKTKMIVKEYLAYGAVVLRHARLQWRERMIEQHEVLFGVSPYSRAWNAKDLWAFFDGGAFHPRTTRLAGERHLSAIHE